MSWSWKLGRIAAIDVYVHFTFFLLLGWEALRDYQAHGDTAETISGLVFILILFGIVVLHELGHCAGRPELWNSYPGHHAPADRRGGPTGEDAQGPRTRVGRGARGAGGQRGARRRYLSRVGSGAGTVAFRRVLQVGGGFLDRLFWVNVLLAIFNLLPAFPMDGGRVLRAAPAMRLDYARATQVAATIGQGVAILFGVLGFIYDPLLIFIALFVWFGAAQEANQVQVSRDSVGGPRGRLGVGSGRR